MENISKIYSFVNLADLLLPLPSYPYFLYEYSSFLFWTKIKSARLSKDDSFSESSFCYPFYGTRGVSGVSYYDQYYVQVSHKM